MGDVNWEFLTGPQSLPNPGKCLLFCKPPRASRVTAKLDKVTGSAKLPLLSTQMYT